MAKKQLPRPQAWDGINELFSTQAERDEAKKPRIDEVPIDDIDPFPNHPFQVRFDTDMYNLIESVRKRGVITPAIVRQTKSGRYQLISGHRRKFACEQTGVSTLPCTVVDVSDDEATILMVESNCQRTNILPSEKAFAYKMRLEAMNRQGQRTDLTSAPVAQKLEKGKVSAAVVGEEFGDSKDQVRRYIRLTNLVPELLHMVDNSVLHERGKPQIAMRPAVEISYLDQAAQKTLLQEINILGATPSHDQAIRMRKAFEKKRLTAEVISEIMDEQKPNQREKITFSADRVRKYFADTATVEQMEDTILKALAFYQAHAQEKTREGYLLTDEPSPNRSAARGR